MISKMNFKKGSIIANRYLILNEKRGGMGRVFFCHDVNNKSKEIFVLKTLLDEFIYDSNVRRRFQKEASVWLSLGNIQDNYVLSLLEIIQNDGLPFLRMQYCSNGSLADRLINGPIPHPQFVRYSTQLLIGMELIDDKYKLVHRDLKPENILIDEQNNVKISDLGLVKTVQVSSISDKIDLQNNGLTQYGGFVGTIPYAAPEQLIDSSDIDQRADIWAFGLILYEMLTRNNPFKANTVDSFIENIIKLKPPHIKTVSDLPNKLFASIIMKCIEKKREDRYSNFRELISDWDAVIRVKHSPKHRNPFKKDKKFLLEIPIIDFIWNTYFPERLENGKLAAINVAALQGIKEAVNYGKIGNYEACLGAYDKVFGTKNDAECYLDDFFQNYHKTYIENGQLSCSPRFICDKKSMKFTFTPAPSHVREALLGKMIALIHLIEEQKHPDRYKELLKSYALRILKANIRDNELLFLSAQALYLNMDFSHAIKIITNLIEKNPSKAEYQHLLICCISKCEDNLQTLKFCNEIIKNYGIKTDPISLFLCAQAAYIAKDYNKCVFFAEKANKKRPNHISCLQKLSAAHIHLGNLEEATYYYKQMLKIDPNSNLTIHIGQTILTVDKTHNAANKDDSQAQFDLFVMYAKGDIVPQDDKKALSWLIKAAENNNEKAIEYLKPYLEKLSK